MRVDVLAAALSEIFETSLAIEPAGGQSPAWQALCAQYGVPMLSDRHRFAEAEQLRLSKGAPMTEVEACVRAALLAFARDASLEEQAIAQAIWTDGRSQYMGYATYRPRSMFAHAIATAHARKGQWERPPGGYVLRCAQCGGPRINETLRCGFCGAAPTSQP